MDFLLDVKEEEEEETTGEAEMWRMELPWRPLACWGCSVCRTVAMSARLRVCWQMKFFRFHMSDLCRGETRAVKRRHYRILKMSKNHQKHVDTSFTKLQHGDT